MTKTRVNKNNTNQVGRCLTNHKATLQLTGHGCLVAFVFTKNQIIMSVSTSENNYQEVFYSEKHQVFYKKTTKGYKVPPSAKPFCVGSKQRFEDFLDYLKIVTTNNTIFRTYKELELHYDNFLGNVKNIENILVEAEIILGIKN